jgi:hypothetical protein
MRRLSSLLALVLLALVASACGGQLPAAQLPLRVLSSDAPRSTLPEPERSPSSDTREADQAPRPRIGAPGGMGAGTRSVQPAQSGNDTVGGLPAGIGAGVGPRG